MSDIHGDLLSFNKMMEKIDFKEGEDFLIVNGDVLDRGEHGIELLLRIKKMVENGHALMLKGNHELFAQRYMEGALSEREWTLYSGAASLKSLKELDEAERNGLLEFIRTLPIYIEREIAKYGNAVITHTGLMDSCLVTGQDEKIDVVESIKKAAENNEDDLLISADIHYWGRDRLMKLDKFIVCGHVPTYQLGPEYTGKIMEARSYMNIDVGTVYRKYGGKLACICIDSGSVWYV